MPWLSWALLAAACVTGLAAPAQQADSKPVTLLQVEAPRLVECAPVSQSPCLSASVTPATAAGLPAPVKLPPAAQLAGAFRLTGPSGEITPFYASAGSGPDAGDHVNVVLLVIDISGSMREPVAGGQSRFEAARSAIAQFLDGMQEGADRVAIVPFESHNVVPTIHSAVFTTRKADALAQLKALPVPGPRNNTALYQAVFTGEESLRNEVDLLRHAGEGPNDVQPHLIVMTAAKNEVWAGDDGGLLNGDLGLQQAAAQVQASHMDTVGIGFGDRSAIDTAALQRLSSPARFFYAADAAQLLDALHVTRSARSHSVTLTWLLPESSRVSLAGRDQQWIPSLHLEDGTTLNGDALRLLVPATAAPVYDHRAVPQELSALIALHPELSTGWAVVLTHGLLYLGAALLLLLCWFWIPRLVWGDSHLQAPVRTERWSSDKTGVTAASGVQVRSTTVPEGFGGELHASPLQRSAAQTTQIQPRGEFSKTRLSFDGK